MKNNFKNRKFYLLGLVLFFYGVLVIPLMVLNSQNKQDPRGRAAEVTPTIAQGTCGNAPTDTIIIIDRSGSMQPDNKITPTKNAAKSFIDIIAQDNRNKVSLVSFSTTGRLDIGLSNDYAAVKSKVDALQADGWTCVECALKIANQEIATNGRAGIKKVIVLLTDGQANYIEGSSVEVSPAVADQKALASAQSGFAASQTQFFTIGLGDPNATGSERFFNPDLLKNISSAAGGKFYFPLPSELNGVYNDISLLIGKASVGGFVFNDTNGNGTYDSGETKVPNWTVSLVSPTYGTKTLTTDGTGAYLFNAVCDGTYSLILAPQSGWMQTLPTDPNGYSITVQNGFSILEKNFGVKTVPPPTLEPSPTASPAPVTSLSLTVFFDGIGNRGDNANPNESSLSNKNPLHPIIKSDVQIFNSSNQLVSSGAGVVTYDPSGGNFKGNLAVSSDILTNGQYTIKVKAARYLRKIVPGIQTIKLGEANQVSPVALVAGDIKDDNKLDILDYNFLLDCYSDLKAAANCSSEEKKVVADINDDGFVNQVDYNLFLREISTQPGQ